MRSMLLRGVIITVAVLTMPVAQAITRHNITLEKVSVNVHDKAAILRGANFFATRCMACHSMRYLQYNKLAKRAGITLDKMPLKQQEWLFDIVPPDLSLIAQVRGANWLYTYLHSFYQDLSRPRGSNNLLVHNTVMATPFIGLQGVQLLKKKDHGYRYATLHYYNMLELKKQGSMTPEQFNQTIHDLVTFLVYAGEPQRAQREALGWWVIGFLIIFLLLTLALMKLYWKDVE